MASFVGTLGKATWVAAALICAMAGDKDAWALAFFVIAAVVTLRDAFRKESGGAPDKPVQ